MYIFIFTCICMFVYVYVHVYIGVFVVTKNIPFNDIYIYIYSFMLHSPLRLNQLFPIQYPRNRIYLC